MTQISGSELVLPNGVSGSISPECNLVHWSNGSYWVRTKQSAVLAPSATCPWAGAWRTEDGSQFTLYERCGDIKRNDGLLYKTSGNDLIDVRSGVRGVIESDCNVVHWSNGACWGRALGGALLVSMQDAVVRCKNQEIKALACRWEGTWGSQINNLSYSLRKEGTGYKGNDGVVFLTFSSDIVYSYLLS